MPGITRLLDITVGICSHGLPCCPHACVGYHITASPDVYANQIRVTRRGDAVTEFCGAGVCVTASPDVRANDAGAL